MGVNVVYACNGCKYLPFLNNKHYSWKNVLRVQCQNSESTEHCSTRFICSSMHNDSYNSLLRYKNGPTTWGIAPEYNAVTQNWVDVRKIDLFNNIQW